MINTHLKIGDSVFIRDSRYARFMNMSGAIAKVVGKYKTPSLPLMWGVRAGNKTTYMYRREIEYVTT